MQLREVTLSVLGLNIDLLATGVSAPSVASRSQLHQLVPVFRARGIQHPSSNAKDWVCNWGIPKTRCATNPGLRL